MINRCRLVMTLWWMMHIHVICCQQVARGLASSTSRRQSVHSLPEHTRCNGSCSTGFPPTVDNCSSWWACYTDCIWSRSCGRSSLRLPCARQRTHSLCICRTSLSLAASTQSLPICQFDVSVRTGGLDVFVSIGAVYFWLPSSPRRRPDPERHDRKPLPTTSTTSH